MYKIIGALGAILLLSPFILGYSSDRIATVLSIILGGILIISSYIEKLSKDKGRWEYRLAVVIGIAVITLPFVMLFDPFERSIWLWASIGVTLVALGGEKLYGDNKVIVNRRKFLTY